MNTLGFIILRHVRNETTNNYWKLSYESVRKHYPENNIVIIDDNSNYEYINEEDEKELYKTIVIKSEYPGRGELLPYYYYVKNKWFDTACFIHDSVFINQYIDMNVTDYKILWTIEHWYDHILVHDIEKMIKAFENEELYYFYKQPHLWKGCFGCMSIVSHDYLTLLNEKCDFSILLNFVTSREKRSAFERVIGCLLQSNDTNNFLFCDIHNFGIPIDTGFTKLNDYKHLPMTKVWSGR